MDPEGLDKVRRAGRIAKAALEHGRTLIRENAPLLEVAEATEEYIRRQGAQPAFPTNLAINHNAAHFTPRHDDGHLRFARGDLVKLDMGVHVDGYLADTALTVEVGTRNWTKLVQASEVAVNTALELMKPGVKLRTVGGAIERAIEAYGYRPIANLTGHSIERYVVHAGKSVPNVFDASEEVAAPGDVLAIEPFSTNGRGRVESGRGGNIYRVLRGKEAKSEKEADFLRQLQGAFHGLPFSERWCVRLDPKAPSLLQKLLRHGAIMHYPVLVEAGNGMVAQREHTLIIGSDRVEVITR